MNNGQIQSSFTIRVLGLIVLGDLIALGIVDGVRGSVTGWLLAAICIWLTVAALRGSFAGFSRVEGAEKKVLVVACLVTILAGTVMLFDKAALI